MVRSDRHAPAQTAAEPNNHVAATDWEVANRKRQAGARPRRRTPASRCAAIQDDRTDEAEGAIPTRDDAIYRAGSMNKEVPTRIAGMASSWRSIGAAPLGKPMEAPMAAGPAKAMTREAMWERGTKLGIERLLSNWMRMKGG